MPPAPTCPRSECRAGEGLASFLGGSGSGRGLATSVGSQSDPRRDPIRVSVEANPDGFPFAARWPEGPGSAGPSKKVGSAEASRFFFEDPSSASVACVPKDTARFRGGRVSEPLSVAGNPLLIAKADNGAPIRFAKAESCLFCLWITGISGVSRRYRAHWRDRADRDVIAWPSRAFGPKWWELALPEACLRLQCIRRLF
ncbi:MAG: hypothetical protein QOD83_4916 [Solirubrobacteraceae bacterium]|nr:hypothetical protein [Solirubrobacteraceae bacterium]